MKLNLVLAVTFILVSSAARASGNHVDVVYGADNRVEAYQRPALVNQSRAVAAMVSKKQFSLETLIGYQIDAHTQELEYDLCETEKFSQQPILAECTGFLVAQDVIMTAGHCVQNMNDCNSYNWVFGYEMSPNRGNPTELDRKNVYQCKSIISRSLNNGIDYAIIKLDRPTNRAPLKLAPVGVQAPVGTNLFMMGYPSGLPLKITDSAQVLKWEKHLLITNLDAFHVNSGSPVFDANTNLVVGILVAGADDYKNSSRGCMVVNTLDMKKGEEAVTSLKVVPRNF